MALSSQMVPRGRGGGSFSPGRRRRRGRPRKVLALIAVAGVAWFGFSWLFGDSPDDAGPAPDAVVENGEGADAPDLSSGGSSAEGDRQRQAEPRSASAGLTGSGSRSESLEPFVPSRPRDVSGGASSRRSDPEAGATAGDEGRPAVANADDEADLRRTRTLETQPRASSSASSSQRRTPRSEGRRMMERGQALFEDGEFVEARDVLNAALHGGDLSRSEAADVRDLMAEINETLIFSPRVVRGDPYVDHYEVQSGDALSRIAPPFNIPWQFIAKINGDLDPNRIRAGQRLKVVNGPFRVVVRKREYRLDVYLEDMYIRSFPVGLGEHDMTPVGEFIVRRGKLTNPEWTNPRTGERYLPDDPENPLGGYWIGIRGTTPETEVHTGYGIHGTIEPETVGTDASMGCIRLLPEDVGVLYTMLTEEQSRVLVRD